MTAKGPRARRVVTDNGGLEPVEGRFLCQPYKDCWVFGFQPSCGDLAVVEQRQEQIIRSGIMKAGVESEVQRMTGSIFRVPRRIDQSWIGYAFADLRNMIRFGLGSPRIYQRLFVRPASITRSTRYLRELALEPACSLKPVVPLHHPSPRYFILDGDWDRAITPINNVTMIARCKARIKKGVSWWETGEIDFMLEKIRQSDVADGCRTLEDVLARCEALDRLIDDVRRGGQILASDDRHGVSTLREMDGINVAITRNGDVIYCGGGSHRLAIAQALGLAVVPVSIKRIHPIAISNGKYAALRSESSALRKEYYSALHQQK